MKIQHLYGTLLLLAIAMTGLNGQNCPPGATTSAKGNQLYLYFSTASDATFPEYNASAQTSPLGAFNVSDLDNTIGTTAQLRNRIFQIVTEDFCEFNVEVIMTTTSPNTTGVPRWQIVGIGSDPETVFGGDLFGVAQDVDLGDADSQDYARVYAGSFDAAFGGAGGALNGTSSTLERWATAIGHTTSHEAGHNYGLAHGDSAPLAGSNEDGQLNHVMATGSSGLTGEIRAGRRRHFSDASYGILAHNVGLNIKTLYNWDFVNPNNTDAHSLEITLLSSASSLSINWWYNGTKSPWRDPTVVSTGSTTTFQGATYNTFILAFNVDKSWNGGADGIAPPGVEFHTGASFNESNPIIVYDTKLKNNAGNDLALHPRMIGFDAGAMDLNTGDFAMEVFNPDADQGDLLIRDFNIQFLPRMADIATMLDDVRLTDIRGIPIEAHGGCAPTEYFELKESKSFRLANLSDDRFVDITYDSTGCEEGVISNPQDMNGGEMIYCPDGTALSLFPSTTIYVTATIIDPNARQFDPEIGEFVNGPLATKVFYQFAGIVPDLNENGIDDLIDIREGTSEDENGNGVVDEAEPDESSPDGEHLKLPWWVYVIWIILLLIIIFQYYKRKSG